MPEYYHIEVGYKRLGQGGYKPEYQLSIPDLQRHNRIKRLQNHLQSIERPPEYILPALPKQIHSLIPPPTEKKLTLIKSVPKAKPNGIPVPQKSISIFLCPSTETTSTTTKSDIASRKSLLLERIKAKQQEKSTQSHKHEKAAWERGEWVISSLFLYTLSIYN
jgi:hypothetical protein